MARILIVEDDRAIADLVALYLRKDGHEVELIRDGAEAWRRIEGAATQPDLIVLDLMLPGLDGRGIARRVRQLRATPIIMLTALDDARDKIEGLELGADDYVTKPFDPGELVARVHAVLRRARPAPAAQADRPVIASLGNTGIDREARRVFVGGQELPLRTKEFDLLAAFVDHLDVALSRDQLLSLVWDEAFDGDTRTVDVHVSRLRERLEGAGSSLAIETLRSVGYRLAAPR